MTEEELRDIAYLTATGNHLTESYDYKDFQKLTDDQIQEVVWEPLEHWDISDVISHIVQIADGFIGRVKYTGILES